MTTDLHLVVPLGSSCLPRQASSVLHPRWFISVCNHSIYFHKQYYLNLIQINLFESRKVREEERNLCVVIKLSGAVNALALGILVMFLVVLTSAVPAFSLSTDAFVLSEGKSRLCIFVRFTITSLLAVEGLADDAAILTKGGFYLVYGRSST